MSAESIETLNTNVLVGFTDQRGHAWHYDAAYQGAESNHYSEAIPVADINRRLFNWEPLQVPIHAEVPTDNAEHATGIDSYGNPVVNVLVPGKMAIVRSDNYRTIGLHSDSYAVHDYRDWLIGLASNVIGETLQPSSAGLLKGGAVAWVEFSIPETIHDAKTGMAFRSNYLATTALDGSCATTHGLTITQTVCDNTRAVALGEMKRDGRFFKIKHTKHSNAKIDQAREALGLVENGIELYTDQIHMLSDIEIDDAQLFAFLDAWAPLPDEKGKGYTRTENKRDKFLDMYRHDAMCADWSGTALGLVQTGNTFAHHASEIRGEASRYERNSEARIKGKFDALDEELWKMVQVAIA
ncbi:hypothetical protein SEA_GIBBLES_116 [Gordonia phage Gibbles]|nr:hypothetical protein SEA_GIBBLES_116 [Gordonia phage Gibbles]